MVKKGRIAAFFVIVAAIAVLISTTVMDITKDVNLGLDLQGGFEILYEVEPANEGDVIDHNALVATVAALDQRINVIGVSEPNIQIEGDDRIRVQLAGVENQQQAREMLSTEAVLTIRDVDDNILLEGSDLRQNGASVGFDDRTGAPVVQITLRDAEKFGDVTRQIYERRDTQENLMVIWLDFEDGDSFYGETGKGDPKFLSAATVGEVFRTTQVQITGDFTMNEAQNLAELLNAGSLPVSLTEIYSNSVGASLGEQAMEKTIYAGFIGVALIFIYMIVYYRFVGVIAVLTLSAYIYLVLLVFNLMNAVLTLPGIAALILGVGMAVDANILTAERIKEELRAGKSVMSAFKAGSKRAFTTILDANLTSLIAAGVMFAYGTSSVQGFAVMLIVGILVSFVTAVFGARILLGLWVNSRALNKKYWLFGVKEEQIDEL
ncbi:protein translocase subunit SecD [Alkalihalobacillus pseudalcaliphilus]|uniref:protein translocase subunit SecD n=1 Tax=Alkalihalobacillus pseudalcaliphilus TaxID=79884 RepID=UPI000A03402C|nr:protein translocase subunit SecD [Alkalihalobacillus pseudalcaliphilus]